MSVIWLLLTTQVIVAVLLNIVFLKERQRIPLKVAAGVLAVVAAVMIHS